MKVKSATVKGTPSNSLVAAVLAKIEKPKGK